MEWDPDRYPAAIRKEIARFDEFQDAVAAATAGLDARRILELGIGTGETARRVYALHPGAALTGIDASEPMLARARELFPDADLRLGRLEDPLPEGSFDLAVSALAVHHLPPGGKQDLFRRIAAVLRPGGRFALGTSSSPIVPGTRRSRSTGWSTCPTAWTISSCGWRRRASTRSSSGPIAISP